MIRTLYKKTISRLLFFAGFLLTGTMASGQRYPVQVVPQLIAPYTLNVSDYYNGTSEKLVVLLTNIDLNKPALQVRLRMTIQGQAAKLISRDNVYYPPIQLDAGVPNRISLADLAPYFNADNLIFEGITRAQYVQSGKLPEGFYLFCFEVIEINSGQVVGRSSCAMAWISLNDPPLLNLPVKAESIIYKDPQNIIFQWTPRNYNSPTSAFNTEYEFTLVELWDNGIIPEAAFGTAQPLYRTTTQSTTLLYGPGEPLLLPGHRYAWRVRAQMANGSGASDVWRNNGYSEIYWFTCQNNCPAPVNVQAEVSGGRATISWAGNPNQTSYTVDYREKGQTAESWYSSATTTNRMMLYDLKKDKTYEYRVGGTCDNGITYTYSDIKTLVIQGGTDSATAACGMLMPGETITNRTPIQTLLNGDVITAGDFPVKLLLVSGQGTFTGAGYVTVPFLGQHRVKVKFTGITINTDKQLIGGVIETTYDPKEGQIADLDGIIDGGDDAGIVGTGVDTADYYVDMVIPDASSIKVDLDDDNTQTDNTTTTTNNGTSGNKTGGGATLNITGSDGTVKEVKVKDLPATIKDKNGTIYGIDDNGNVTKIGQSSSLNMTAAELNNLQTSKAVVKFKAHDKQQYAFDEHQDVYNRSNQFSAVYQKLNGNYYVNAKAIGEAKTDLVKAVVEIKDNTIKADSIQFITGKGTRYESKPLGANTFEVNIVGGPGGDAQELYALYPQGGGKYLSLGKLLITSFKPQTRKLVLVPVDGAEVNKDKISQELNAIYNPLAVSFEVTQVESFNDQSWDIQKDGKLAVSGSGWLSNLTDEMKALNAAFKNGRSIMSDAVYLFVLKGSDSTIAGDMPRGKQFGYLFTGTNGKVAAHEVGHGLFKLKHVFDGFGFTQGQLPSNVMDYPVGDRFTLLQWKQLHDPGVVIGVFDNDGDGQLKVSNTDVFKDLKNVATNTYTFLSPGGSPVTLPATATDIVLSETNYFVQSNQSEFLHTIPFGTLVSFKLQNGNQTEQYIARGRTSSREFTRYNCEACAPGGGKDYVDNLSAKETTGNIIIAYPCITYAPNTTDKIIQYSLYAKWITGTDALWQKTKAAGYLAAGKFADAEAMLEKEANAAVTSITENHAYKIGSAGNTFSDFRDSKAASDFLVQNTLCGKMPLPVIINIANLIKLYPAEYIAFVSCSRKGDALAYSKYSNGTLPDDQIMPRFNEDAQKYLNDFNKYLQTAKQERGSIATITDSDEMETLLGNMCVSMYNSLTVAERKQILKVLTQSGNLVTACYFSDSLKCEETQLIKVIETIPDQTQANEIADYLDNNLDIVKRLIEDVDAGDNHDLMMTALFNLYQKKEVSYALSAEGLLKNRISYKVTTNVPYKSGTSFNIKTTIFETVSFNSSGVSILEKKEFDPGTTSISKTSINLENNGFTRYNIKPFEVITVIFGEDFKLTSGEVVFKKGDIAQIPALYLWQLYDQDAKQTAKLLRINAFNYAMNAAALLGGAAARTTLAEALATLDVFSLAYATVVNPMIQRNTLSSASKEVLEAFDALTSVYLVLRGADALAQLGVLVRDYSVLNIAKIRLAKANAAAGSAEKRAMEILENMAESAEAKAAAAATSIGWKAWDDYEKTILFGEEYAKIGNRFYSHAAVDAMAPVGFGAGKSGVVGQGVTTRTVESIIALTENTPGKVVDVNAGKIYYSTLDAVIIAERGGTIIRNIHKITLRRDFAEMVQTLTEFAGGSSSAETIMKQAKELYKETHGVYPNTVKETIAPNERQRFPEMDNAYIASPIETEVARIRIKVYKGAGTAGNYAFTMGNVGGMNVDIKYLWESGAVDLGREPQIFEATYEAGKSPTPYLRNVCSEYKMLNWQASKFRGITKAQPGEVHPEITGELIIASESKYCPSCDGIIVQYRKMFPNVKLILINEAK
jgi:hypothetical protein